MSNAYTNVWIGHPDRVSQLEALWREGVTTAEIGRRLGVSKSAVIGKAYRLGLPERGSPIKRAPMMYKKRVRVEKPKVTGIVIPLREVYRLAAQFGVPRTKRNSIEALNKAVRRTQPDHPGFVLGNRQRSRIGWAI